ncbi:Rz1-like lysis system protein LysC [Avibacterium paragallinarum]|uniref:Rz1-like lysis system protein LysC n=2 Tax=Avibacterium paragallinarum TaxID=728 RepID=UPI00397B1B4D
MHLTNTKIGLISLCLLMCNACSIQSVPQPRPILCPQSNECGGFSSQIRTNGELVKAYIQANQKLRLCVMENDALKKCITEFNQQEKQ